MVDKSYFEAFRVGQVLNQQLNVEVPALMSDGVETLVALLQLRAELNTIAGVLAQVPNTASVADLVPLRARYRDSVESVDAVTGIVSAYDKRVLKKSDY